MTATSTSVRFLYRTPASPVASLTPASGGRFAIVLGAKGEIAWAFLALAAEAGASDEGAGFLAAILEPFAIPL
jgi:hypothetical protein